MMDQARGLRDIAGGSRPPAGESGEMRTGRRPFGAANGVPRVVAVTSGKGGVGKTSLVLNLSIAAASSGARVVVLDADLGLGNIDLMLGIVPKYTLANVAAGEVGLEEVATAGPGGIKIVPCGSGVSSLLRLSEDERAALVSAVASLERGADLLVLDTGAGLSPGVTAFLAAAHEVIVITTPEPTAIADAYAAVKVASGQNPTAPAMLIVNMARDLSEAEEAAEKIALVARRFLSIDVSLLGFVPRDPLVARAVMQQEPFVLRYPSCPAARAVTEIARRMMRRGERGSTYGQSADPAGRRALRLRI